MIGPLGTPPTNTDQTVNPGGRIESATKPISVEEFFEEFLKKWMRGFGTQKEGEIVTAVGLRIMIFFRTCEVRHLDKNCYITLSISSGWLN